MPMNTDSLFPNLLGGLTHEAFLRDYWQQKPLLIRQAIPGFGEELSPEELAGLACEEGVEARLILEKDGAKPWEVRHGPFAYEAFDNLPETHWTLLVQDVEKHIPDLKNITQAFDFIPNWRRDDLMVSYAADQGNVGPHTDQYDVFLLQGHGKRRWSVGNTALQEAKLIDGLELCILEEFQADDSWDLEPGDMLYLPPGFAHHGVGIGDCMTWSIGFRAPTVKEMAVMLMERLLEDLPDETRFVDAKRSPADDPSQIDSQSLAWVRTTLRDALQFDDSQVDRTFASLVSENKAHILSRVPEQTLDEDGLIEALQAGEQIWRDSYSRFTWLKENDELVHLYADGEEFTVKGESVHYVSELLNSNPLPENLCNALHTDVDLRRYLVEWINRGYFCLDE